jgi:hypothetical protein
MSTRPIVTLTTDFGGRDHYVAAMKAAILRVCPEAAVVDVTHHVAPQDVAAGSVAMEGAIANFDPGSVHLAVVDPGVGMHRRLLAGRIDGRLFVCPDNGLITWAWKRRGPGTAGEITWRPAEMSETFHGRDVMAPVAARLAAGEPLKSIIRPIGSPVLLSMAPAKRLQDAVIIYVDHYGNAVTNVGKELLTDGLKVMRAGRVRRTYGEVAHGEPLALVNSSGLLEIAVREGSAASTLGLTVGEAVRFQ